MACCLTLAVLVALVRRLAPGRRSATEFAPPAVRSASQPGGQRSGSAAPTAPRPGRHGSRSPLTLLLGAGVGVTAYLVDVIALTGAGTLSADVVVRASLATSLAIATTLAWQSTAARERRIDPALVLGIAGIVFGTAGLIEMHVLHWISFTSPSVIADVAFHGAGPLLALQAAAIQWSRAATQPMTAPH